MVVRFSQTRTWPAAWARPAVLPPRAEHAVSGDNQRGVNYITRFAHQPRRLVDSSAILPPPASRLLLRIYIAIARNFATIFTVLYRPYTHSGK